MAELAPQDQLQPSLLDRLTDEEPHKQQESRDRRVMSVRRLQQAVMRDLAWLLNTENLASIEDLDDYPFVAESVVNYGLPALTGRTISTADVKEFERHLKDAICNFEPRIRRDTLTVKVLVAEGQMNRNAMSFDIEGQLWAQPAPLRLLLRSDLNLETGEVRVTDRGSG